MGDTLLHGVLNMPPELWQDGDPLDQMQRHQRYAQASELIRELEAENAKLRRELAEREGRSEDGSA